MSVKKIKGIFLENYILPLLCLIVLSLLLYNLMDVYGVLFSLLLNSGPIIVFIIDYYRFHKIFNNKNYLHDIVYNFENELLFTRKGIYSIRNRVFYIDYDDIVFINYIACTLLASSRGYNPDKIIFHTGKKRYVVHYRRCLTKEKVKYIYRVIKEFNPNVDIGK